MIQTDGQILMRASVPFELYYFNGKLNFYEPFIEKTCGIVTYSMDKSRSVSIDIEMQETFNINFSVALYDTLSLFLCNMREESDSYYRLKENKEHA